jgi:cell division protein FtsI/penicillin-binding protein 2
VRWEWFHYGKPRTRENLYFEEFTRDGPTIVVATNVDRRGPPPGADPSQPAVEMR